MGGEQEQSGIDTILTQSAGDISINTNRNDVIDVTGVYDKTTRTFKICVSSDLHGKSSTVAIFNASGRTKERTVPDVLTFPKNGERQNYYIPHSIPNGTYKLGIPEQIPENTDRYTRLGPVFVPIEYYPEVEVYGEEKPIPDPSTGLYIKTGTQIDSGYGIHADMAGYETTLGCITFIGENKTENAIIFGSWVRYARNKNGRTKLLIWSS